MRRVALGAPSRADGSTVRGARVASTITAAHRCRGAHQRARTPPALMFAQQRAPARTGGLHFSGSAGGESSLDRRLRLWDEERARQRAAAAGGTAALNAEVTVRLTLPDGTSSTVSAKAGTWTPAELLTDARACTLADGTVVVAARVDGEVRDLLAPVHGDCDVELVPFDSPDGRHVLWHSAAHVLGGALEARYGDRVKLCDGPPLAQADGSGGLDGGFFYEMFLEGDERVSSDDLAPLESAARKATKQRQRFDRLEVSREFAESVFADNRFKLEMLAAIPETEAITLYRCGRFVDMCRGPHVPHTGVLKGIVLTRCGGSHWRSIDAAGGGAAFASEAAPLLQRVYGVAFPTKEEVTVWKTKRDEAARRDHRIVGKQQGLFFFDDMSPGSAFFLPAGTRVINRLLAMLRKEYAIRGYDEVMSPLIYKKQLWAKSGHLDNYAEHMYFVSGLDSASHDGCCDAREGAEDDMGLKPMNCPGHCLIFSQARRSYKDLPMRLADFSALHRNEHSGSLGGLTRVRRFHQDDAHIFCTPEQVGDEVRSCLDFVDSVYSRFGFQLRMLLSTRPEKAVGSNETWAAAEAALAAALDEAGHGYEVDVGAGAFYGPKVDIVVTDALGREHQCATIQLDFQLPERFELQYDGPDGSSKHQPVMIHRAILGSVERMFAILIEHTGGRWPFWLSPRQIMVCAVADRHEAYASAVADEAVAAGLFAEADLSPRTVSKKVREAQMAQVNLIVVVGDSEEADESVTVRFRDPAMAASAAAAIAQLRNSEADVAKAPTTLTLARDELVPLCELLSQA